MEYLKSIYKIAHDARLSDEESSKFKDVTEDGYETHMTCSLGGEDGESQLDEGFFDFHCGR